MAVVPLVRARRSRAAGAALVLAALVVAPGDAAAADPPLTIAGAHAALEAGSQTSVGLTRRTLRRIDRHERAYNAFDRRLDGAALRAARASDARRRAGRDRGPLDGVPVVVKDSIDMAGLPTTGGWKGFAPAAGGVGLVPRRDAPVVARLRRAGAVIVGKTNLPAFSASGDNANTSWAGPTFNALNRGWAPGGSSTGTATAVAADFAATGLAEETGGSIQNPAAAQSLVGVKPTFALVPNTGVQPLAGPTRDVVGPIAKTVTDAATMLDVLAGYTLADPKTTAAVGQVPAGGYAAGLSATALNGTRLGLYGAGWRKDDPLDAETTTLYTAALGTVQRLGATTVADPFAGSGFAGIAKLQGRYDARGSESLPFDVNNYLGRLGRRKVGTLRKLDKLLDVGLFARKGPMRSFISGSRTALRAARRPTVPPDLSPFFAVREHYLATFAQVMDGQHLDALVYPQATKEIGGIAKGSVAATTVSEINIAGLPAVVVPAGRYASGKPFSLIFVGRRFDEARLLAYAFAYEQAAPGRVVPGALATGRPPRVG